VELIGGWGESVDPLTIGTRWQLDDLGVLASVWQSGRPARLDDYTDLPGRAAAVVREAGMRSAVASPITVQARLWGAMSVLSPGYEPLPEGTEARLADFTELVATAIANAESRGELASSEARARVLADEQAALRRVATLVARETPPDEVFAAVVREVGEVLGVDATHLGRYDADGTVVSIAQWGRYPGVPIGARFPLEGDSVSARVLRTGRPARIDSYEHMPGDIAATLRRIGIRYSIGVPVSVQGRPWGVIIATSKDAPFPAETESRLQDFTEFVATAIGNAQARSDLAASRARIVAAADEERRRVVRDLHDGAQQRLVHTAITLKLARRALEKGEDPASLVAEALDQAERATDELRELAHGIMPAVLARGGLRAGVEALASRMSVPVTIDVSVGRPPAAVEATGYFVVAEALTNVAKHSRAGRAAVTADVENGTLRVRILDDGVGGARPDGSGFVGLADRLAAIDGQLSVESPAGGGTLVAADIPLPG
jgi:signal transduction histidine kinase